MFVKPSDIAKLSYEDFQVPYEIEGHLLFSNELTHLVDIDSRDSNQPHYGILLNPRFLEDLLSKSIPPAVGTMVQFTGRIRMKATLTYTGFSILPARVGYIYNYSFENKDCKYEFHISDTFKNVVIKSPAKVTASILKDLKSNVEKFQKMTVMDIKKYLAINPETIAGEHIEGDEFKNLLEALNKHRIAYEVSECPIRFGIP